MSRQSITTREIGICIDLYKTQLDLLDNRLISLVSILVKKLTDGDANSHVITMTLDYVSMMGSKFNRQQSERHYRRQMILSRSPSNGDTYFYKFQSFLTESTMRIDELHRQIKLIHICLISI